MQVSRTESWLALQAHVATTGIAPSSCGSRAMFPLVYVETPTQRRCQSYGRLTALSIHGTYSTEMKQESTSLRSARMRAAVFKALAHPIRLTVVDALSRREHYVCELAKMLPGTQANLSKHLKVLLNVGIVRRHREGAKMMYELALPCAKRPMPCIAGTLRCSTGARRCEHGRPKGTTASRGSKKQRGG